ncbi:transglycosylase SLT domain-containing protein [Nonomuraea sp. NPDC048882]|uniref:transglycosylase SLT domain-containing protein n=1 Tax=Nonomuraea sp. NPDC048882 TaxID=3154347 RepID=UPI0033E1F550
MSPIDDVRAAPGGGELAGLALKVIGDPAAITAAAKAWRAAAGTAREHTGALTTAAGGVDGAWQGAGADAFTAYLTRATGCGGRLAQVMHDCAGHLDTAARALSGAESEALGICAQYAAAAHELRSATPPPTEAQVTERLAPALETARADLRRIVADTGTALSGAAGLIQNALATVPDVAGELPEPDTQPFTPTPGRPLGWSPEHQAPTTLAAATPSSGAAHGPGGFGGYGPSGPPPSGGGPAPPAQVAEWISQAVAILKANGVPAGKMNPDDIWTIIRHESNGNPHAINNWDSNAAKGTPSKGLMQTIDPTFERYRLPGHGDVYDPVDNIIAGVRYAIARYGSVSDVPGLVGMRTGAGYSGY